MLEKSIVSRIALVSLALWLLSPAVDAQERRQRHYNQNNNQQVQQGNDLYEQENARAEEQARQMRVQQHVQQPGNVPAGEAPPVRGTVGGAAPYGMSVMPATLPPAKGSAESWGLKDNFPIPVGQDDAATFALPQAPAGAPGPATGPRTHRFR